MDRTRARQVRADVADAGRSARNPIELERLVAARLERVIPFDGWCGMTTDPGNGQITGGFHENGLPEERVPRLLDIESGAEHDVFRLKDMRIDERVARTLSDVTDGDLPVSARYRDVFSPSGIRHEVRMTCRDATGDWGVMIFMRGDDVPDFSAAELALLGSLSGRIAEGIRRATVVNRAAAALPSGPGLVLLTVGQTLVVDHETLSARAFMNDIDDGSADGIPYAITALARQAIMPRAGQPALRTRLLTRSGRWITAHADRIGASGVSIILEPSHPHEIAALLADAYRLTQRERDVVALAVRGHTTAEIAKALWLSPFTVQDHLKSTYGKVGVSGRGELAAALLSDDGPQPLTGRNT